MLNRRLLSSSPVAASSTTESAIWPTTSTLRSGRRRLLWPTVRPVPFSEETKSGLRESKRWRQTE